MPVCNFAEGLPIPVCLRTKPQPRGVPISKPVNISNGALDPRGLSRSIPRSIPSGGPIGDPTKYPYQVPTIRTKSAPIETPTNDSNHVPK